MQLKKSLTIITRLIFGAFIVIYPFAVFWALNRGIAIRFIGLFVLAIVCASYIRNKNRIMFLFGTIIGFLILLSNHDLFVKLYPVLMNAGMCATFAISLTKTPLITMLAQKTQKKLNTKEKEYTRNLTLVWAVFMGINTVISLITVFLSNEIWVLYNGLISYILIGCMMGGEYIFRKILLCSRR